MVSSGGRWGQDMKKPQSCIQSISTLISTPVPFTTEVKVFSLKTWRQSLCSELAYLPHKTVTTFYCLMNCGTKSYLAFLVVQAEVHDIHTGLETGNVSNWTVTLPATRYPQTKSPSDIQKRPRSFCVLVWGAPRLYKQPSGASGWYFAMQRDN